MERNKDDDKNLELTGANASVKESEKVKMRIKEDSKREKIEKTKKEMNK